MLGGGTTDGTGYKWGSSAPSWWDDGASVWHDCCPATSESRPDVIAPGVDSVCPRSIGRAPNYAGTAPRTRLSVQFRRNGIPNVRRRCAVDLASLPSDIDNTVPRTYTGARPRLYPTISTVRSFSNVWFRPRATHLKTCFFLESRIAPGARENLPCLYWWPVGTRIGAWVAACPVGQHVRTGLEACSADQASLVEAVSQPAHCGAGGV
jgi:hypothetical protein